MLPPIHPDLADTVKDAVEVVGKILDFHFPDCLYVQTLVLAKVLDELLEEINDAWTDRNDGSLSDARLIQAFTRILIDVREGVI